MKLLQDAKYFTFVLVRKQMSFKILFPSIFLYFIYYDQPFHVIFCNSSYRINALVH